MGEAALPGGTFYDDVNPWTYLWLYYSFLQEEEDRTQFHRSMSIFQGSFSNYEMAKAILKADSPTAEMDDEEFEALSENILAESKAKEESLRKRQRKLLLKQRENKRL